MNKKMIIGIGLILLIVLSTNTTAPEGESPVNNLITIEYKDANMTVEFKEEGVTIGQATLKSHKTYDEIRKVTTGKSKTVIWYELSGFTATQENAIGQVEFIDMRKEIFDYNGKEELKEEDIEKYIKPNPDYLQPIQKDYNIIYLKEEKWEQYNKTEIPK